VRRQSVVVLAETSEVHDLRNAGRGRSATEGACADPVALDEVRVGQRVDQVAGDILAVERRLDAPNVSRCQPPTAAPRQLDLQASYDHGVLTVTLPVSEQAQPRKIAIGSGSGRALIEVSTSN